MSDISETVERPALVKSKSETSPTQSEAPSAVGAVVAAAESVSARIGKYRWVVCGLLFFATTVNYIDRQVLGILSKDLKLIIGWSEVDYGNIVAAFNAAYAGWRLRWRNDGRRNGLYFAKHWRKIRPGIFDSRYKLTW
ncbi:MAG TPA: hypothetical protein VI750_00980 [Pyrinomonadaceae bacterium]|nr:hypothetical protein [Pyrinomonadaceae bacterium]HLE61674.1 hypothetical protein [Pyrinomonadaceae bacterium]